MTKIGVTYVGMTIQYRGYMFFTSNFGLAHMCMIYHLDHPENYRFGFKKY